jgi:hypothetical protein
MLPNFVVLSVDTIKMAFSQISDTRDKFCHSQPKHSSQRIDCQIAVMLETKMLNHMSRNIPEAFSL